MAPRQGLVLHRNKVRPDQRKDNTQVRLRSFYFVVNTTSPKPPRAGSVGQLIHSSFPTLSLLPTTIPEQTKYALSQLHLKPRVAPTV